MASTDTPIGRDAERAVLGRLLDAVRGGESRGLARGPRFGLADLLGPV